jgi:hypothetical protein
MYVVIILKGYNWQKWAQCSRIYRNVLPEDGSVKPKLVAMEYIYIYIYIYINTKTF